MLIGESRFVMIDARSYWNDTGLTLIGGQEYDFQATGTWRDSKYESTADGYESPSTMLRLGESLRRVSAERWFALIGVFDKNPRTAFLIGSRRLLQVPLGGRLFCFANDAPFMYFNNVGSVRLTVTRRS